MSALKKMQHRTQASELAQELTMSGLLSRRQMTLESEEKITQKKMLAITRLHAFRGNVD